MLIVALIVLFLLFGGSFGNFRGGPGYGYGHGVTGGFGLLLLILLVLFLV